MTDEATPPRSDEPGGGGACCSEFRASRRSILRGAVGLGAGLAVSQAMGDAMVHTSYAGTRGGNTLVVLSLRGGIDGVGLVVPHGDPGYYRARPTTAIGKDQVICADSMFGLHPKMMPLAKYWNSGDLAAVQAVGIPVANRSHFSAIEEIESAAPDSATRSGWINRMIGLGDSSVTEGMLDGVQLGQPHATTAMKGDRSVLAALSLDDLKVYGIAGAFETPRYTSLERAWSGSTSPLAKGTREAIQVSKMSAGQIPASATTYPASGYADALRNTARVIRADLGTDVIALDVGAWDFHADYGTAAWGSMQLSVDVLAKSIACFLDDLGPLRSRVTLVTISEFGRRIVENGSRGFDHGWGNMMLVAGGGVKGGRYYGNWPGLGASALADGDLKVTTDYRDVLGEIVTTRFPGRSLTSIFPEHAHQSLGLMGTG